MRTKRLMTKRLSCIRMMHGMCWCMCARDGDTLCSHRRIVWICDFTAQEKGLWECWVSGQHSLSSYGTLHASYRSQIISLLHSSTTIVFVKSGSRSSQYQNRNNLCLWCNSHSRHWQNFSSYPTNQHRPFLIRSWVDLPHIYASSLWNRFHFRHYRICSCLQVTSSISIFPTLIPGSFHPRWWLPSLLWPGLKACASSSTLPIPIYKIELPLHRRPLSFPLLWNWSYSRHSHNAWPWFQPVVIHYQTLCTTKFEVKKEVFSHILIPLFVHYKIYISSCKKHSKP